MIEDRKRILTMMKEMEPYLVEFREDGTMKDKNASIHRSSKRRYGQKVPRSWAIMISTLTK